MVPTLVYVLHIYSPVVLSVCVRPEKVGHQSSRNLKKKVELVQPSDLLIF